MPSHSLAKERSDTAGRDRAHASVTPGARSSGSEYWTSGANNGPLDHERATKGRPRLRAFGLNFVSHRHPLIHWVMLLALVVMWGSSFGLTKIAVSTASADSVVAARLLVAGVFLVGLLFASGKRVPRDGRVWLAFMAMAVMGNVLPYWLISWGQETVESGLAGVLMAVMPLVTLVLAHFFVKDDRMTRSKAVGFLLGFLGVVILMSPGVGFGLAGSGASLLAQLAIIAGAVCYAINTIIAKHCSVSDSLVAAAGTAIAANLLLVPVAWNDLPALVGSFDLASFLAVVILGVVSTALAPILYFHLIRQAGPTFFSLINYLIPVWALLFGILFLEESLGWTAFAGMAFILGGIAVSQFAKGQGSATRETSAATRVTEGSHRSGAGCGRSRRSEGLEPWQLPQGEVGSRFSAERQSP